MIFGTILLLSSTACAPTTPDLPPRLMSVRDLCRSLTASGIPATAADPIAGRTLVLSLRPRPWTEFRSFLERGLGIHTVESPEGWTLSESDAAKKERETLSVAYDDLHLGRFRAAAREAWRRYGNAARAIPPGGDLRKSVDVQADPDDDGASSLASLMAVGSWSAGAVARAATTATRSLVREDAVDVYGTKAIRSSTDPIVRLVAGQTIPPPVAAADLDPGVRDRLLATLASRQTVVARFTLGPLSERLRYAFDVQFGARADYVAGASSVIWPAPGGRPPALSEVFKRAGLEKTLQQRQAASESLLREPWALERIASPVAPRSLSVAVLAWARRTKREIALWSPGWRDVADPLLVEPTAREFSLADLLAPRPRVQDLPDDNPGLRSVWLRQSGYYRQGQSRGSSWAVSLEPGVCVIRDDKAFMDGYVDGLPAEMASVANRAADAVPTLRELVEVARSLKSLPSPLPAFNDLVGLSVLPCLRAMSGLPKERLDEILKRAERDGEARVSLEAVPSAVLRAAADDARECSRLLRADAPGLGFLARARQSDSGAAWRAATLLIRAVPMSPGSVDWELSTSTSADRSLSVSQLNPKSGVLVDLPLWSGHVEAAAR